MSNLDFIHVEFSNLKTLTDGDGSMTLVDADVNAESLSLTSKLSLTSTQQAFADADGVVTITNMSDFYAFVIIAADPATANSSKRRVLPPKSDKTFACGNGNKVGVKLA